MLSRIKSNALYRLEDLKIPEFSSLEVSSFLEEGQKIIYLS